MRPRARKCLEYRFGVMRRDAQLTVIPRESGVSSIPKLRGSIETLWDTGSPAFAGDDGLICRGAKRRDDHPNTFAPEGASRCRALTSGLKAGRRVEKNVFSRIGRVKPPRAAKVKAKQHRMRRGLILRYCNKSHFQKWRFGAARTRKSRRRLHVGIGHAI